MADPAMADQVPLQDKDLLLRMSWYFDTLDQKLRQGHGWFIFNADSSRSQRIIRFVEGRLRDSDLSVDSFALLWRDFALNAYVNEIGIPQLEPGPGDTLADERLNQEIAIARHVSKDLWDRFQTSDLLMVIGLQPAYQHEVAFLDKALEARYLQRRATIILTPEQPQRLEADLTSLDPETGAWDRLIARVYERSLVAL